MRMIAYFFKRIFLEQLFIASAAVAAMFTAADIELLIAQRSEMIGPAMILVPPCAAVLAATAAMLHRRFNPNAWPWRKPFEEL